MLEALVLSLGLMDQSYFIKEDLRDRFIGLLENLQGQHIAVLIGCPRKWDMHAHKDFPVYVAYKWAEGASIRSFPPADYGYIIVSSLSNGDIRIVPLIENAGKIPLPAPPKKSPPPPGTNVNKVTISYDGDWKVLSGESMQWAGEKIAIAVVCGPTISNTCSIAISDNHKGLPAASPTASAKSTDYYFVKTKQSPALPDSTGINFSFPEGKKVLPGEPYPLYGSFVLPHDDDKDVLIHLLFSQPKIPGIQTYPVVIPKNAFKISKGKAQGYFLFDMMKTMYWKRGERFDVPDTLFVSGVSKGVFSDPVVLKLKQK
jgi:hypothetical protein